MLELVEVHRSFGESFDSEWSVMEWVKAEKIRLTTAVKGLHE
jgi:hypothetical protein